MEEQDAKPECSPFLEVEKDVEFDVVDIVRHAGVVD
jgi:hypothetical protein